MVERNKEKSTEGIIGHTFSHHKVLQKNSLVIKLIVSFSLRFYTLFTFIICKIQLYYIYYFFSFSQCCVIIVAAHIFYLSFSCNLMIIS